MEDSNAVTSSFAIVRANVSSTSLPSATRYQTSIANSSRCSSSTKHHGALSGDGVDNTNVNEVAMVVAPSVVGEGRNLTDCGDVMQLGVPNCWAPPQHGGRLLVLSSRTT